MTSKTNSRATKSRAKPAPDHTNRNVALGVATAVAAIGAGIASALHFGLLDRLRGPKDGHRAPDLEGDTRPGPQDRAPEAFRPDPTAPVPASEREALRPATGPAPTLAAERGSMASGAVS